MDITITPRLLNGTVRAIPSKSQAHRLLICAAFADRETSIFCPETNDDIEATVHCLNALNAHITKTADGYIVKPTQSIPEKATLNCNESGSTLRFMLPIVGALGVDATFQMDGRLPQRPLSPLWEEMERMGCSLSRPTANTIHCKGKLRSGDYSIRGNVSSQFITGLLFAMVLINNGSLLKITDKLESKPYIDMTLQALNIFGVCIQDFKVAPRTQLCSPGAIHVEGDWSNGAFFLAANTLGCTLNVEKLDPNSMQGDRAVATRIKDLDSHCTIDAADIPDLVPILSIVAAAKYGAVFTNIQRLRMKESDRVAAVINMLHAFGIQAESTENTLTVYPGQFHGATVDSCNDHRIAMSAAIGATIANGPVTILNADCVKKSYPAFWQVYEKLGGKYEQHIR